MSCDNCEIHKNYLERIISMQREEIVYLKSLVSIPQNNNNKQVEPQNVNEAKLEHSIFDIIDEKMHSIDISFLLGELSNKYPAKKHIENILRYFIINTEYCTFIKMKGKIQYIDTLNKLISESLESFAKTVCQYIFKKVSGIVKDKCQPDMSEESDYDYEYNNNCVRNVVILSDENTVVDIMKNVIKI
jgi:hypothetical protein